MTQPDDQENPIYAKARAEANLRAETPPIEEPTATGTLDESVVQRMIDQALARQAEQHRHEMDLLRGQLATARAALPATLIPEHAGGVGVDAIAETWSQYDQDLARRGEHPHQHDQSADWLARPEDVEETRVGPNAVVRVRRAVEADEAA